MNKSRLSSQIKRGIKDHINAVREVEAFFVKQNIINDEIIEQLKFRKFNIRSNFLNNRFLDYEEYKKDFIFINRACPIYLLIILILLDY